MGMGTLYISEARVSWVGIQGQVGACGLCLEGSSFLTFLHYAFSMSP